MRALEKDFCREVVEGDPFELIAPFSYILNLRYTQLQTQREQVLVVITRQMNSWELITVLKRKVVAYKKSVRECGGMRGMINRFVESRGDGHK